MDTTSPKNPALAAGLSLIIPGAGQMYCGQVGMGAALLIAAIIGYWIFIVPGVIVHVGSIAWAYMKANQLNREGAAPSMGARA
ncbi:MAG TPA: hypothetical protein VD948_01345 [Rhodothermales bacterium]|nr:hypothetical protein [Rhodothermales bacterium]